MKTLLSSLLFAYLSIINLTLCDSLQNVINDLQRGRIDLGKQADFVRFCHEASAKYPNSGNLYDTNQSQNQFIMNVIKTTVDPLYTQGLLLARLVCGYAPFTYQVVSSSPLSLNLANLNPDAMADLTQISTRFKIVITGLSRKIPYIPTLLSLSAYLDGYLNCAIKPDWMSF